MVRLYACLGSGNCYKPWLVMNQLGVNFELILVDVLSGEQKGKNYRAINPLGVVPYLVTTQDMGIGESNAMLWYIAEGSNLIPDDAIGRAEALQWMFFEQSRLEPFISPARFFTTILPDQREAHAHEIAIWQDKARPGLDRLNTHLESREFMLGSVYSVADISLFGYVHTADEAGIALSDYPAITRWIHGVSNTPGFLPLSQLCQPSEAAA